VSARASAPRRPLAPPGGQVVSLERARILRALADRSRYRYVRPRVEPEGRGWVVVSPNCSRNIDPEGGEIAIAWLQPVRGGWALHARDHARDRWRKQAGGLSLTEALAQLCSDPQRIYWP